MLAGLVNVNWDDLSEAVPVAVVCITMPLTFSIANGIAFGFISYAAVRLFSGHFHKLNASVIILASLFLVKFVFFI
jgi:AGZA family xanthine/uracil permease-like MFS transporter